MYFKQYSLAWIHFCLHSVKCKNSYSQIEGFIFWSIPCIFTVWNSMTILKQKSFFLNLQLHYISIQIFLHIYPSIHLSVYLFRSINPPIHLSIYIYIYTYIYIKDDRQGFGVKSFISLFLFRSEIWQVRMNAV